MLYRTRVSGSPGRAAPAHIERALTLRLAQAMAHGFARVAAAAGERAVTIWAPLAEGLTIRGMGAGPAPQDDEEDGALAAEATAQGERASLSAAADSD